MKLYPFWITLWCVFGAVACEQKQSTQTPAPAAQTQPKASQFQPGEIKQISNALFDTGSTALKGSGESFLRLAHAIKQFLSTPNQEHLLAAQTIWLEAVLSYRHFFYFRHIGLVAPDKFPQLNRLDYQLASFPIQPGFLDTFGEYPYSGLVHDISFPLSPESLANQHGLTDLSEGVLGLYAIEFMLFDAGKPRNYEDFLKIEKLDSSHRERGFEKAQEIPNNRRRLLLSLQAEILLSNNTLLLSRWQDKKQDTTSKLWEVLPIHNKQTIAMSALESALTQILLEIGALNQSSEQMTAISHNIMATLSKTDAHKTHQSFIRHALESTLSSIALLPAAIITDMTLHLTNAIEMTNKQEIDLEPKDYWQGVFTKVKQAIDLLPEA